MLKGSSLIVTLLDKSVNYSQYRRSHWKSYRRLPSYFITQKKRQWLLDRGSLTQRLIEISNNHFRVDLLKQYWGTPRLDESLALGVKPGQRALIREVVLYGNDEPWIYARTIIPAKSLMGSLRYLKHLGNKPLGALLFSDPGMKRGSIEIAQTNIKDVPIDFDAEQTVWGRRSVFYLSNCSLLVNENFLPAFDKINKI